MKTLFKLTLLLAIAVYLVFAFTRITRGGDTTRCTAVNVVVTDSTHAGFITADEVKRLLNNAGLYPMGLEMEQINGDSIERTLLKNSFIKLAKCYKTPGGRINIHIAQRLPVMRIKADNGEDYYVDTSGSPMMPENYTADLAVATGQITKAFAKDKLVHLARCLHNNTFANDLILQINVDNEQRVDLIPRMGCQVIRLGKMDTLGIRRQMANLQTFYSKVLPTVGLNTYREINMEYSNQIICKKF